MSEQAKFHELRLPCAGLRYVALLGGVMASTASSVISIRSALACTLGRWQQGRDSPPSDDDCVHEIQRVENGKLVYKYIATLKCDPCCTPSLAGERKSSQAGCSQCIK